MSDEQLQTRISLLEDELKQSRLYEERLSDLLEKKLNEIYIHYHISRAISSLLHLPETLAAVTAIIKKFLHFDRISVYLLDETRTELELVYAGGFDCKERITLKIGEGTPGRIVENGEHVHIHDLSAFYETFTDFIHYRNEVKRGGSYIGVALKVRNETIGVMGMDNAIRYGLNVDDMDFMAILSHQIAAGIEKARLFEKVQHMSQHDGLTGLYNYRIFQERLQREIVRTERTHKPLSLVMLDIDDFKKFNDSYGHLAGDEILKQLSAIIMRQIRSHSLDICCRYGGEEFTIVMPEQEYESAFLAAERLRKAIEAHTFVYQEDDRRIESRLTVSIGVATMQNDDDRRVEALVKKADEALYQSKRAGKNRVS